MVGPINAISRRNLVVFVVILLFSLLTLWWCLGLCDNRLATTPQRLATVCSTIALPLTARCVVCVSSFCLSCALVLCFMGWFIEFLLLPTPPSLCPAALVTPVLVAPTATPWCSQSILFVARLLFFFSFLFSCFVWLRGYCCALLSCIHGCTCRTT